MRIKAVMVVIGMVVSMGHAEVPVGEPVLLSKDGSWCWFQDERALIDGDQLLFTGVTGAGATIVSSVDLRTGERRMAVLNGEDYEANDHNVGVLLVREDGRYLAVYAGHNADEYMRHRISVAPGDIREWGPEVKTSVGARAMYSNVYRLEEAGVTYNFHRGIGWNPNYMVSGDEGESWRYGGRLFKFDGRPYLRYASDGMRRVHFIATEHHPRDFPNSIYHGYIEAGKMFGSDGSELGELSAGEETDLRPGDFTRLFEGDENNVGWTSDIELDGAGHPHAVFSVTKDRVGRGQGGSDHRYHYARWDGSEWHANEIGYAGTRLYSNEDEYTGLIALHPGDMNVVYVSADVDPANGEPLLVGGERRYEIFRGRTGDGGVSWRWEAVTENSEEDNLRPIVVVGGGRTVVLWLRGRYTTYTDFDMQVWGLIEE